MHNDYKLFLGVLVVLGVSFGVVWWDGSVTGQLSMVPDMPQLNVQQQMKKIAQAEQSSTPGGSCCAENKAAIARLSLDLQGLRGQVGRPPACCNDNSAAIARLSQQVENLRNQPASSGGGSVSTTNCCNLNSAEIVRLSQQNADLQSRIVSLERHVQDLELDAHREAQASGDSGACVNTAASAEQMNCQEACDFRNQRCDRAELIRFRRSDSQRMAPLADSCSAALRSADNEYSYSYSCRCCPR